MLTFIPNKSPGGIPPQGVGQTYITSTSKFTVPDGITSICAVCVGPGAKAGTTENGRRGGGGGGGGGLAWANNIPVTPGEQLDIVVGLASQVTAIYNAASAIVTSISRNGTVLMSAMSGRVGRAGTFAQGTGLGGIGGTFFHHASLTDKGGGNGGTGGGGGFWEAANDASAGGGAGAGGYTGPGGNGGPGGTGSSSRTYSGSDGSGGGGGGAGTKGTGQTTNVGGGVGLQGQGANGTSPAALSGTPGSPPGPYFGGGTSSTNVAYAQNGGCRIIWGNGRKFPSTLTADQGV